MQHQPQDQSLISSDIFCRLPQIKTHDVFSPSAHSTSSFHVKISISRACPAVSPIFRLRPGFTPRTRSRFDHRNPPPFRRKQTICHSSWNKGRAAVQARDGTGNGLECRRCSIAVEIRSGCSTRAGSCSRQTFRLKLTRFLSAGSITFNARVKKGDISPHVGPSWR